ncbi:MFS transporter [Sphaerisporangium sp. NPDC051011]|uniref:MFS transporter n=1 Tax=Sphaerisporangium sp. NPDC051011 TaxID=3155792 RepID=UPI0033FDF1BF
MTMEIAGTARETRFPDRGFIAYWSALGVSQLGSAVSMVAVPLIGVVTLGATPGQMTWLAFMELAPCLLVRLPAAAWSDSLRDRVPYMIACNAVQAAVMALIPVLWWAGVLSLATLLPLAGLASLALGVYSSLSSPLLVQIVPAEHLVDANGKTSATRSVADISGPAIGSALMSVVALPLVVLIDAASFVASALLLTRVRPVPAREGGAPPGEAGTGRGRATRGAVRDVCTLGVALVRRSGMRAGCAVAFVNGIMQPVLVLFMVHDLRLAPSAIGLLLGLGAFGGITGGLTVGRIIGRRGGGRTLAIGTVISLCAPALLPFGGPGVTGAATVVAFELCGSFGGTLMIATIFGALQAAAGEGSVAKVMALAGTLLQVATLCGVFVGGLLGTFAGPRGAVATGAALLLVTLVPQLVRWSAARWTIDPMEIR